MYIKVCEAMMIAIKNRSGMGDEPFQWAREGPVHTHTG